MTRVSWNDVGQRFYEAGTDRGVLYLAGQPGVPWNGLIGVDEGSSGGEARPYYLDGYKYLNMAVAEEFTATIKAYTSPREFDSCDGTAAIHHGLFATQQPRKPFGFSYRTLVGNDVDGLALGYKIHIVYNALASPSSRAYQTIGDTASPTSFGWGVTTVAPQLPGIRPTAHFVIDSRITPPRLMETIEGILYGSMSAEPRLPTADELATLFKSLPPIAATNWMTNGSFEYSTGTVLVRSNLNTNPRLNNSIIGWGTTAAVATIAATASGAQIDLTANGASTPLFFQNNNIAAATADRISSSMEVTVPNSFPAVSVQLRNYSYGTNVVVGESPIVTIEPGTTVTIVAHSTIAVAADTTGVRSILYSNGVPLGARFFVKNALIEKAMFAGEYFDGSQQPRVRRNWSTRPVPSAGAGWFSNNNTIYTRSYDAVGGPRGTPSALFTRQNNNLNTFLASVYAVGQNSYGTEINGWTKVVPGEVWTVSGGVRSDTPFRTRMSIAFFNAAGSVVGTTTDGEFTQDTAANGSVRATQTIEVPVGARYMGTIQHVVSTLGTAVGGEKVWMFDGLIEKVTAVDTFFDSTTPPPQGYLNASEGAVGASPSYMYDGDFTVAWAGAVDASVSNLTGLSIGVYVSPTSVTRGVQSKHWTKAGTYSFRQIPVWTSRGSGYTEIASFSNLRGMVAGQTYTLVMTFYQKAPKGFGTGSPAYRSLYLLSTSNPEINKYTQAQDVSGEQTLRLTFTVPTSGNWYLRFYNGGMAGEDSIWWDSGAIFDGTYAGEAFNGDTPDTDIRIYDWIGLPNQSESTLRSWYY